MVSFDNLPEAISVKPSSDADNEYIAGFLGIQLQ